MRARETGGTSRPGADDIREEGGGFPMAPVPSGNDEMPDSDSFWAGMGISPPYDSPDVPEPTANDCQLIRQWLTDSNVMAPEDLLKVATNLHRSAAWRAIVEAELSSGGGSSS